MVPIYRLEETDTPKGLLGFHITIETGTGITGFPHPFEIRDCFNWLEHQLLRRVSTRIIILGHLGKDINQLVEGDFDPHLVIRGIWRAWYTQSVQAKAALLRQKVSVPR
jgi:hypothetical protein